MLKDRWLIIAASAYGKIDRRSQLLVLTLHRVGISEKISPRQVEKLFYYLSQNYRVTSPSKLENTLGRKRVAIVTIDDCHSDTYDVIFPIAKEMGIPITVCVPTDFFFREQWLWFDKVKWGLSQLKDGTAINVEGNHILTGEEHSVKGFSDFLKNVSVNKRDMVINKLMNEIGVTVPDKPTSGFQPVNKKDMGEMLESGFVEISSHSASHPIMTSLSDQQLEVELVSSKHELEVFSGKEVPSFCYPNGGRFDFDERSGDALKKAGYKMGFTSIVGLNRPSNMDFYAIKRIHGHQRYSIFLKLVTGLGELQTFFSRP